MICAAAVTSPFPKVILARRVKKAGPSCRFQIASASSSLPSRLAASA